MKKVLVFGSGDYFQLKKSSIEGEIVGFIDNIKNGSIEGRKIYRVSEIKDLEYDLLYIMAGADLTILFIRQCIEAEVDLDKIVIGQNLEPHSAIENLYMHGNPSVFIDGERIIYDNGKVKLYIEDGKEFAGIVEMLGGNVYGFESNAKEYVVIDIGMNIGIASLYFASREDVCKVYAYEPFSRTYEKALLNIQLNENLSNKIIPVHAGLCNEVKKEKVIYNKCMPGALTTCPDLIDQTVSYYRNNYSYEADKECIEKVQLIDAADEIKKIISDNPGRKIVLKMDCEGSEYPIMEELEQEGLLEKVSVIMMEWHYKGADILKERLKRSGFTFFGFNINESYGTIYAVKS